MYRVSQYRSYEYCQRSLGQALRGPRRRVALPTVAAGPHSSWRARTTPKGPAPPRLDPFGVSGGDTTAFKVALEEDANPTCAALLVSVQLRQLAGWATVEIGL